MPRPRAPRPPLAAAAVALLLLRGVAGQSATPSPRALLSSPTPTPTFTPVGFDCFADPLSGVSFTRWLNGTSGVVNGSTALAEDDAALIPALWGASVDAGDDTYPPFCENGEFPYSVVYEGGAHLFAIDMRAAAAAADDAGDVFPWGGTLSVDTCNSAYNTVLLVGFGCPYNSANFGCVASSDNDLGSCAVRRALPFISPPPSSSVAGSVGGSSPDTPSSTSEPSPSQTFSYQSAVEVTVLADAPVAYVIVGGIVDLEYPNRNNSRGRYSLRWSYAPPSASSSASPSDTPSASSSASSSPSASVTPSASASDGACVSHTPLWTASGSASPAETATPQSTGTATVGPSQSQTSQSTYSPAVTPSGTPSRTGTASGTPGCVGVPFNADLTGPSGEYSDNTEANPWPLGDAYTDKPGGGGCLRPEGDPMAIPIGNKHAFSLNLGLDQPLGGILVIDLCLSGFDTQLFVSASSGMLGCPSGLNAGRWACTRAGDDECGVLSKVMLDVLAVRQVYVILGGYQGRVGAYTFRWNYTAPDVSPTARATSAGPRSRSATSTLTVGASRSNSATVSRTPSNAATVTSTPASTGSNSRTPTSTAVPTSAPFSCGMRPDDVAVTARVSGTSGRYYGTTAGAATLFSYGACSLIDADEMVYGETPLLITFRPHVLVAIDIGGTAESFPPGTQLVVDTCDRATSFDTVLFLGTSCPSVSDGFPSMQCVVSNDDACKEQGALSSKQSGVMTPLLPAVRVYYALVQSYDSRGGSFALSWRLRSPLPSPSASPSFEASISNSPSVSRAPSRSRTPASTPSARVNAFRPSSVLALVVGGSAYARNTPDIGEALPVSFYELASTTVNQSSPIRVVALPSSYMGEDSAGCTLATGKTKTWLYEQEGLPTLSVDGQFVTLPCYSTTVGTDLGLKDYKTLAVLYADGRVDTSTYTPDVFDGFLNPAAPQAMRCAATVMGPSGGFYVSGGSGFSSETGSGGLWYVSQDTTTRNQLSGASAGSAGYKYWGCTELYAPNGAASVINMYGSAASDVFSDSGATVGFFSVGGEGSYTAATMPVDVGSTSNVGLPGLNSGGINFELRPTAFVHESATSVWLATHRYRTISILHFTLSGGVWSRVAADDLALDPALNPIYSLFGRREGTTTVQYVLYAASRAGVWRYNTFTSNTIQLYAAKPGEQVRGVVNVPVNSSWRSPVAAPAAASPSSTGTVAPSSVAGGSSNRFQRSDSVLVLRAGDGMWYKPGSYMPLFWDEMSVAYAVNNPGQQMTLQSIALPAGPGDPTVGYKCVLPQGSWAIGIPSTAADGRSVIMGCFDRPRSADYDSTDLKTIAWLDSLGQVDTTTRLADAYMTPNADGSERFASVVAESISTLNVGGRAWSSGYSGADADAGIRLVASRGASVSSQAVFMSALPSDDLRSLFIHNMGNATNRNNTMYVAFSNATLKGIGMVGVAGSVSGQPPQNITRIRPDAAFAGVSIRSFAFENATRLWVACDHALATVQLILYTSGSGPTHPSQAVFGRTRDLLLDDSGLPLLNVVGRPEGPLNAYVVFAATSTNVFRIASVGVAGGTGSYQAAVAIIATAPNKIYYRGVVIPPYHSAFFAPTASRTPAQTPTGSSTAARTPLFTTSGTPVPTATSSREPSPPARPSNSSTPLGTPSNTGTGTMTPSRNATPTNSGPPLPEGVACAGAVGSRVSVGDGFACAADDCGRVRCWGRNESGQLAEPLAARCGIRALGSGADFSCALSHAGAVYCWGGANALGQLDVPLALQAPGAAAALAVGAAHACVVTLNASGVACWGGGAAAVVPEDIAAAAAGAVTSLAAGAAHSCAVVSGAVRCWGAGAAAASPLVVSGALSVHAGARHSCALLESGTLRGVPVCWGANEAGQTAAPAALLAAGGAVTAALGDAHSCFLHANGSATCTGAWSHGAIVPPASFSVPSANRLLALSSGASAAFACGVSRLGNVTCFGAPASAAPPAALQVDPSCERPIVSPKCTPIVSPSPSGTGSSTPSGSWTSTASSTPTASVTAAATLTSTGSGTSTATSTASFSSSGTSTGTSTGSQTAASTATSTASFSSSGTSTGTSTGSWTAASTASSTASLSAAATASSTASVSAAATASRSSSGTATASVSAASTGSSSSSVSASAAASVSAASTGSSSVSASAAASVSAASTGSSSSSVSASAAASVSAASTGSSSSSISASGTAAATSSSSASGTASGTATPTGSRTSSPTATSSATAPATGSSTSTRTSSGTVTPTSTRTVTGTATGTSTRTPTTSATATATATRSGSFTASPTATATATSSTTPTRTPSGTSSPTSSRSATASQTGTTTQTGTASLTGTATSSGTASQTRSGTPSLTQTGTSTSTATSSGSLTATATVSATSSETGTSSSSQTGTASVSRTPSQTSTDSASATSTGSPSTSRTGTGTGSPSATKTGTGSPSATGTGSAASTNSRTAAATRSRSAAPTDSRTAAATDSRTAAVTRSRTAASTYSRTAAATRSRSVAPTGTASPSATRSDSKTPFPTRSASRTPAPGLSLVAVRVGDAGSWSTLNSAPGTALPVSLDVLDVTTGRVLRSVPLAARRNRTSGDNACTLSFGSPGDGAPGSQVLDWSWETEGAPSHDAEQSALFLGCHTSPAGGPLDRGDLKSIALATAAGLEAGRVDTTAAFSAFVGRRGSATGFKGVYSPDARRFWLVGVANLQWGLRYLDSVRAAAAVRVAGSHFSDGAYEMGTLDARAVGVYRGKLVMSSSSLFEPLATANTLAAVRGFDSGSLPTSDADDVATLPGFELASQRRSLYGFVFAQRNTVLYAVDDRATYARVPSRSGASDDGRPEYARTALNSAIIRYDVDARLRWGQDWGATVTLPGVAVYCLVGRTSASGAYALYTASPAAVLEVLPATKAVRVVATAAAGTQWRGVAFPPLPPAARGTPAATRSRSSKPRKQ